MYNGFVSVLLTLDAGAPSDLCNDMVNYLPLRISHICICALAESAADSQYTKLLITVELLSAALLSLGVFESATRTPA